MELKPIENGKESGPKKQTEGESKKDPQATTQSGDVDQAVIQEMITLLKKRWPQPKLIVKKPIRDLKVLVVDDQSSMRTIVKNMLKEMGFQSSNIDDASDGMRAVEKLKTNRYDLIVCDWIMPNLNGLQLLKIVKGVSGFKNTIFIMVTAEGQKSRVVEAIKYGVDNYVVKPFSVEQITKKLKMVISKIAFI
jgi:two-component system chemotaxis response regulator CheY